MNRKYKRLKKVNLEVIYLSLEFLLGVDFFFLDNFFFYIEKKTIKIINTTNPQTAKYNFCII